MAELKIFWTQTAIKQRNYIFEYWTKRNKSNSYAQKLNIKIKERVNLLRNHPNLGKQTDFKQTRLISLGHYSILYKKVTSQIIITGFWDNRQSPEKLLAYLNKN